MNTDLKNRLRVSAAVATKERQRLPLGEDAKDAKFEDQRDR